MTVDMFVGDAVSVGSTRAGTTDLFAARITVFVHEGHVPSLILSPVSTHWQTRHRGIGDAPEFGFTTGTGGNGNLICGTLALPFGIGGGGGAVGGDGGALDGVRTEGAAS